MSETSKFYLVMFAIIAGLAMLGGGGYAVYTHYKERGIRNNNPGNLRPGKDPWQGQSGIDNGINGPYLIFKGPEWGIRAMYKVLMTYRNKYGLDTVAEIITRWAPAADKNNTGAYIAGVSKALKVASNAPLPLTLYPQLVKEIIKHENGIQPYPDELIRKGISLA